MNAIAMIERCARGQALTPDAYVSVGVGENDIETTNDYVPPTDHGRDDVVGLGVEVP